MENIIQVCNLKKSYGHIEAVKCIDLHIRKGSFCAFLGPNGAGKSTTIDILSTIQSFDEGEVIVNGYKVGEDNEKIKANIGIVFQDSVLDQLLSVKENLMLRSKFYPLNKMQRKKRISEIADLVGITPFLNQKVSTLSGGQRRKCDIARALLCDPELLILDEPTTGLDPKARKQIWNCIRTLKEQRGMSVFLTTHYMEEASNADQIIIIKEGRILVEDTPSNLKRKYALDQLVIYPFVMNAMKKCLDEKKIKYLIQGDSILITLKSCFDSLSLISQYRLYIKGFEVRQGSLDDAFLNIMEETL